METDTWILISRPCVKYDVFTIEAMRCTTNVYTSDANIVQLDGGYNFLYHQCRSILGESVIICLLTENNVSKILLI